MSDPKRIGLFGGSFDPIHFGHLISARDIAEQLNLEKVIVIPCGVPPHKQGRLITPGHHRFEMARLAVAGDSLFEVSDIEIQRTGPSYTFDTVTEFHKRLGAAQELYWIIGADSLPELPTWHRISELAESVALVTAARPGFVAPPWDRLTTVLGKEAVSHLSKHVLQTPEIGISATNIRARVSAGKSIRYLTPDPVVSYISAHGLYRDIGLSRP